MYKLIAILLLIIAALQYRLWLGDGGIREFHETNQRINELRQEGERRRVRNAAVAADIQDLRDGADAIEERARHELGMIKPGETYVQVYESPAPGAQIPLPAAPGKIMPAPAKPKAATKPALRKAKPGAAAKAAPGTPAAKPKPANGGKPKAASPPAKPH